MKFRIPLFTRVLRCGIEYDYHVIQADSGRLLQALAIVASNLECNSSSSIWS